jgi:hypothetical protein
MLRRVAKFAGCRAGIIREDPVEARRRNLSKKVFRECCGVIRYGPLTGMQLIEDASWGPDKGAMILGLYESEVLASLFEIPHEYRIFVDIGAADGYYAVGLLKAKKFERAICFELSEYGRRTIKRMAAINGISGSLNILGAADINFVETLLANDVDVNKTAILMDIEGHEFSILDKNVLNKLSNSIIIIELHSHMVTDGEEKLRRLTINAGLTHKVMMIAAAGRNPFVFAELVGLSETNRWIICSEGRSNPQRWMRLDPL